jgi:hypothetical protein
MHHLHIYFVVHMQYAIPLEELKVMWFTHSYELCTSTELQVWRNEAFPIPDVFYQLCISNKFIRMTWNLVL